MARNNANIWNGIKTFLEAYTAAPALIKYGGDSFDPPGPNVPYWIVDYIPALPERLYYAGDDPHWNTGTVVVGCMIPIVWTDLQTQEYAGAIADYFAPDTEMGLVRVGGQPMVSSGFRDGDRFRVPVVVSWEGFV